MQVYVIVFDVAPAPAPAQLQLLEDEDAHTVRRPTVDDAALPLHRVCGCCNLRNVI